MLDTVGKCKHGQGLRHKSLLHDIIKGRMKGKARKGRKRMHLLSDLMKNRSYTEVKRAQDRVGCTVNVTNMLVTAEDQREREIPSWYVTSYSRLLSLVSQPDYERVPAKRQWQCSTAGKVTTGLVLHQACVTDSMQCPYINSMVSNREMSTLLMLMQEYGHSLPFNSTTEIQRLLQQCLHAMLITLIQPKTTYCLSTFRLHVRSLHQD